MGEQYSWAIDVNNVLKRFGQKVAVNRVSLKIKKGEVFGFLGPNGSGKTTTMRMICGLLTLDEGEGTCLGHNIITDTLAIHNKVGYMTQKFSLYDDLTVRENIDFVARLYGVEDRAKAVDDVVKRLGFGWRMDQLAGSMSGGWKQRLALASALVHRPELLLLDEPTAGVDPSARRDFWDQIHELASEGITTLVSTHYMDEADRCHRLGYVAYGDLIAYGTAQSIIASSGLSTYVVRGDDLFSLEKVLKQHPGIDLVSAFGTVLHVSAVDSTKLAAVVREFDRPPYQFKQIETGLEDVFIYLMSQHPEQESA